MAQYYDDRSLLSGNATPQFDVEALMKAGGVFQQTMSKRAENEAQDFKLAQDKMYKDEQLGIQKAGLEMQKVQAAREQDKYNREMLKEAATSEAMQATLNPSKYSQNKLLGEQQAAEAGIANLSPDEQVIARQQMAASYDPKLSGQQWLTGATSATNVDQGKLFDTKTKMYEVAVNTPGTPEFNAKKAADQQQKQWEIGLQAAKQKEIAKFTSDLANENKTVTVSKVDPKTGIISTKEVKLAEVSKYPEYEQVKYSEGPKTAEQIDLENKTKVAEKMYEDKKEKEKAKTTSELKVFGDLKEAASKTADGEELLKVANDLHDLGMSYSEIESLVAGDLNLKNPEDSKSWGDFGKKDIDLSPLYTAKENLEVSKVTNTPVTNAGKIVTPTTGTYNASPLLGGQAPYYYGR